MSQPPAPPRSAYALIIGIDHYYAPQAPDLLGCRNDAIAWYRLCRHDLHIPAENITIAASPKLTPEQLGPGAEKVNLIDARHASLTGAIHDLSAKLSDRRNVGLLTYSGHGVVVEPATDGTQEAAAVDLSLCPSDTSVDAQGTVTGDIGYRTLHDLIGDDARDNLTVVLDTCHTGATRNVSQRHLLGRTDRRDASLAGMRNLLERHPHPLGGRTLLAVDHGQTAEEIVTPGGYRGAFSHCTCLVMQRWQLRLRDGLRHYDLSHEELMYRVRLLLSTLEVHQRPQLLGSPLVPQLPLLAAGMRSQLGDTSRQPNRVLPQLEFPINPNKLALVELLDPLQNVILYMVVVGSDYTQTTLRHGNDSVVLDPGGRQGREYFYPNLPATMPAGDYQWVMKASATSASDFQANGDVQSFIQAMNGQDSPTRSKANSVYWGTSLGSQPSPVHYFYNNDIDGNAWCLGIAADPDNYVWYYSSASGNQEGPANGQLTDSLASTTAVDLTYSATLPAVPAGYGDWKSHSAWTES